MGKPILALDFDGVCHSYKSGWQGITVIPDEPVPGLFEFLDRAVEFFDIQIYSTRSETREGRAAMELWFHKQRIIWKMNGGQGREHIDIEFPEKKPIAFVGIDDRVITFTGEWPDMEGLKRFQPWYRLDK